MVIATLFIIAKMWKQPKYSFPDEWKKKRGRYIYGILSGLEKGRNSTIRDNMNEPWGYYTK